MSFFQIRKIFCDNFAFSCQIPITSFVCFSFLTIGYEEGVDRELERIGIFLMFSSLTRDSAMGITLIP